MPRGELAAQQGASVHCEHHLLVVMFMLLFLAPLPSEFGLRIPRMKMLLWEVECGDEKR